MKKAYIVWLLLALCVSTAALSIQYQDDKVLNLYSGYYALIIGNSDYLHYTKLPGVKQDLVDVKEMFESLGINTTVFENRTGLQMKTALSNFVDVHGSDPDRALIFYFAGHGYTEQRADGSYLGYIIPVDAPLYDDFKADFRNKAISMTSITEVAELIQSKHVLMIFDSCFSGTVFTVRRSAPQAISEKTAQPVRQFITAGSANETVPDESVFKVTLLKGLGEAFADINQDGYVTGDELGQYLQDEVANYSNETQHPQYGRIKNPKLSQGDFVFVLNMPLNQDRLQPPENKPPRADVLQPNVEVQGHFGELRIMTDFDVNLYLDGSFHDMKTEYALNIRSLSLGEHRVEVFLDNAMIAQKVRIKQDEITELKLVQAELRKVIESADAFTLNSKPSAASFSLENYSEVKAQTPFVFVDYSPQQYHATFHKSRYKGASFSFFSQPGGSIDGTITLEPNFGGLKLSSQPSNALVYLDDRLLGCTPLEFAGEKDGLEAGEYDLRVETYDKSFGVYKRKIVIPAGSIYTDHIDLKSFESTIRFSSDIYPIQVFLDGEQFAVLDSDAELSFEPGILNLKIVPMVNSSFSLRTIETSTLLGENENRQMPLKLIMTKSILDIDSELKGVEYVLQNAQGVNMLLKHSGTSIYPGEYVIKAKKWGYYDLAYPFTLRDEAVYKVNIDMQPIPDRLMQDYRRWEISTNLGMASLILALGSSVYLYKRASSNYDDYLLSNSPQAWDKYEKSNKLFIQSLYVDILPALWFTYSFIRSNISTSRVSAEMKR